MTEVVLAFGANLPGPMGEPAETVAAAMDAVAGLAASEGLRRSRLFRTPSFPPGSGPDFVNAAAALDWADSPEALLTALHDVEHALGRTRKNRWEARKIDMDIIAFGDTIRPDIETEAYWRNLTLESAQTETPDRLILPHPRLAERAFVLVPMCDVAPDWHHPVLGLTAAEMRDALPKDDLVAVKAL